MNTRLLKISGIAALVVLLAVPLVYAQQQHGRGMMGQGMGMGPLGHLQKLQTELGLSDAQVTQIKTIFTNLKDQNAAYRTQLKGGMQSIMNTLLQDPNNVAAAQTILNQQSQAQLAIRTNTLKATSQALNVLTSDQRAKLSQLIAERQARRQSHGQ